MVRRRISRRPKTVHVRSHTRRTKIGRVRVQHHRRSRPR